MMVKSRENEKVINEGRENIFSNGAEIPADGSHCMVSLKGQIGYLLLVRPNNVFRPCVATFALAYLVF